MSGSPLAGLSVLVLEDDLLLRKQITSHLRNLGAETEAVGTVAQAREALNTSTYDFALFDVRLPDGLGTDLLKGKLVPAHTGTVIMTAEGGIEGAIEAIQLGALDYLVKPFDLTELPLVMSRARKARQNARLDQHRKTQADDDHLFFGESLSRLQSQMDRILAADARVKHHLPPVLIEGETGTGKTTIARLLHHRGPRADQPLVDMNCSALPDTLAESELFGHEKGAFTDARSARLGLFEAANAGTLFLDELPSLSSPLQAKVLKVVEDHRIRRLGGNKEIPIDVRIIAATHRNLKNLVEEGQFREDLYHRLDLYRLTIPPLRNRGDDIIKLALLLMERLCQRHKLPVRDISPAGKSRLLSYPWPGNVRELAHELERAIVFEDSPTLTFANLHPGQSAGGHLATGQWFNPAFVYPDAGFDLEAAIHQLIQHALKQSNNNVSAAARLLGVSRDYLRYRLSGQKTTPGE